MPTSEPACSRFDYEEKLLAKTIRLEVTVEDLVKRVTQTETTLKNYEEKTGMYVWVINGNYFLKQLKKKKKHRRLVDYLRYNLFGYHTDDYNFAVLNLLKISTKIQN